MIGFCGQKLLYHDYLYWVFCLVLKNIGACMGHGYLRREKGEDTLVDGRIIISYCVIHL